MHYVYYIVLCLFASILCTHSFSLEFSSLGSICYEQFFLLWQSLLLKFLCLTRSTYLSWPYCRRELCNPSGWRCDWCLSSTFTCSYSSRQRWNSSVWAWSWEVCCLCNRTTCYKGMYAYTAYICCVISLLIFSLVCSAAWIPKSHCGGRCFELPCNSLV